MVFGQSVGDLGRRGNKDTKSRYAVAIFLTWVSRFADAAIPTHDVAANAASVINVVITDCVGPILQQEVQGSRLRTFPSKADRHVSTGS